MSSFCAAVERAPEKETSVAEARQAAEDVERHSPPDIRAEVTAVRRALETVSTPAQMRALARPGSPVKAAIDEYHSYIENHCDPY